MPRRALRSPRSSVTSLLTGVVVMDALESRRLFSTIISSPITTNTFWSKANGPYDIRYGNVSIENNATLTIEKGAIVGGDGSWGVTVNTGKLIADGVTFSSGLTVSKQGTLSLKNNTFNSSARFEFDDAAPSSVVTGNTFNSDVVLTAQYSGMLKSNTFKAGTVPQMLSNVINTAVELPKVTNVSGYSIRYGNLSVAAGGSLTIAAGNVIDSYGVSVDAGGKLTATGVTFTSGITAARGAKIVLTGNIFSTGSTPRLEFSDGGTPDSVLTGNVFNGGALVSPQYVYKLAANTFAGNSVVRVFGDNISTAVEFPRIANVTAYELAYGGMSINNGGTLTLANGTGIREWSISVNAGGKLNAAAVSIATPINFNADSGGIVQYCKLISGINIDGKNTVSIANNDLSKTSVVSNGSGGPISLQKNYWGGTTVVTDIEAKFITDYNDDTGRPDINVGSPLAYNPIPADLSPASVTVASGTYVAGTLLTVKYNVKNIATGAALASEASTVSFKLKNKLTGAQRTLTYLDVPTLSAAASTGDQTATLALPPATDAFYGSTGLPGTYQLVMTVDASKDVVEAREDNNTMTSGDFTLAAAVAPAAPSSLTAVGASSSTVTLTWADNSTNETGFKIDRSTTSAFSSVTTLTVAANVTSYTDTKLTAGTTYYYRVRATNAGGDSANTASVIAVTDRTPFAVLSGGTLTVYGTDRADTIALSLAGSTLTAKLGSAALTFSKTAVTSIKVLAGAGDDSVTIGSTVQAANVDGGAGNDQLLGGNGNDTLLGGTGTDFIVGNGGNDSMDGGDGNDVFFAVDGTGFKDSIRGSAGTDLLYADATDTKLDTIESVII